MLRDFIIYLKHQTDLIMDVPNATTTTTTLTESARRTNVLLVELDRPPICHMVANTSSIVIPKSPALLKADTDELSEDSDAGSAEKFFGRQPPNIRKFDGSAFADWLTAFIISIGTIPYLSYAFKYDEPIKDARFDERRETMTAAEKRRLDSRFKRRHQYWTQSNATLLAILMEATKDFQPAKQLVSDMIKQRKKAFEILVAIHQTFYPMNEAGKQNAITALFSAASTISDATTPSAWITTLEGLWQKAREAGAVIQNEELPSLLMQGLKKMLNSKIFAEIKMVEQTRAGAKYDWPTAREETLQHEKQAYGEETKARPGLVAQVGKRSCLACGESDHLMKDCEVLQLAQKWSKENKPHHSKAECVKPSGGGKFSKPQCDTCGKFHRGECHLDKRKVSNYDNESSTNFRRDDDRDDEDDEDSKFNPRNAKGFGFRGSLPYHTRDKSEGNYYQGRSSKGGMSAMIAAAVQYSPTDSFIDSCCDSVYVSRDTDITDAIRVEESVSTAKPDSFIKVIEEGRIDDLPVRKTEEALPRNLIGIGPLCDLGWKLTFEGNTCTITRDDEEIIVPRKGNLYSINIEQLSKRSLSNHVAELVQIPQEQRRKGEIINDLKGTFAGYGEGQPSSKVYVFKTKEAVTSSDVICDELTFPESQVLATSLLPDVETEAKNPADFQYLKGKDYFEPDEKTWSKTTGIRITNDYIVADRARITGKKLRKGKARSKAPILVRDVEQMLRSGTVMNLAGRSRDERSSNKKTESTLSIDPQQAQLGVGGIRKSVPSSPEEPDSELDLRGRVRSNLRDNSRLPSPQSQQDPKEYMDSNADLPDSIRKAMESEDESEAWMEAIRNEVDYLDKNVWIPETSAPPKRPLNTKLVFKRKFKSGQWKYKVRLDACVYDQREALLLDMKIPRHIDIIKAYLNAEIDEETYVKAPSAIFRYLQQTKHLKQNHTDDHLSNLRLHAYSDSDFTACSNTARSIAGYLIYKGPTLLKWLSKRKSILAQNPAEAEHIAENDCISEKSKIDKTLDGPIMRGTHST